MPKTCEKCHCFSLCEVREAADSFRVKLLPFFPTVKLTNDIYIFTASRCSKYLLDEGCKKEDSS